MCEKCQSFVFTLAGLCTLAALTIVNSSADVTCVTALRVLAPAFFATEAIRVVARPATLTQMITVAAIGASVGFAAQAPSVVMSLRAGIHWAAVQAVAFALLCVAFDA